MTTQDVRWLQRLDSFQRALQQLRAATALAAERPLSDLEGQGLVKAFEFTHELAWNVMKDYFAWQGASQITGSRDATRQAFATGLVADGEAWMEMIQSRNLSSHTYNPATAQQLTERITSLYTGLFTAFAERMEALRSV